MKWRQHAWHSAVVEDENGQSICSAGTVEEAQQIIRDHNAKEVRPESEYHEDHGSVLWWVFPIQEPPYVGSPLNEDWPGYHTHWSVIAIPEEP